MFGSHLESLRPHDYGFWFLGSQVLGRLGFLVPRSWDVLVPWFQDSGPGLVRIGFWCFGSTILDRLGSVVPCSWIVLVLWFLNPGSSWFFGSITVVRMRGPMIIFSLPPLSSRIGPSQARGGGGGGGVVRFFFRMWNSHTVTFFYRLHVFPSAHSCHKIFPTTWYNTGWIGSWQQLAENAWLVSLGCSGGPQRSCGVQLHIIQLGFEGNSLF